MNKLKGLAALMIITILVIAGFQLYWMKNNYAREKRILEGKTGIVFRTTVLDLQAKKLDLHFWNDSIRDKKVRIEVRNGKPVNIHTAPGEQIVNLVNVMGKKLKDSLPEIQRPRTGMVVTLDKTSLAYRADSVPGLQRPGEGILRVLYGIDSLQDSLQVTEIKQAVEKSFAEEKMKIPFRIIRLDSARAETEDLQVSFSVNEKEDKLSFSDMNEVTVGFAHPVTYRLQLENTFPYLLKKITTPLLFSLFLVGVTILSFVLLYRNLLQQKKLSELKNDFISNMTHELKTPIATVNVAIEALRNFGGIQSPERTKEYLDISAAELQRLGLLVDKVLKLSMFEKKELELRKENFDILKLVNEVTNTMKLQFEKNNAVVNIKAIGDNFMIEADRLHITSVIYNLLDNALKYSKGNPAIEISLSALPNDIIELKVSDNGIGIPKEYKWKIFDKFFRVPSGNTHNVKGYGLGLSYLSEIIKRHMGFVDVESDVDKGATFIIKMPRKEADVIQFDEKRKIYRIRINVDSILKGKQRE